MENKEKPDKARLLRNTEAQLEIAERGALETIYWEIQYAKDPRTCDRAKREQVLERIGSVIGGLKAAYDSVSALRIAVCQGGEEGGG